MLGGFVVYIRSAFDRCRAPIAYILVVVAVVFRVMLWGYASDVALVALATILLSVLLDIHHRLFKPDAQYVFDDFEGAGQVIVTELNEISKSGRLIEIRYFGLTLKYWHFLENSLPRILSQPRPPRVDTRILILDPEWEEINTFNPAWRDQCAASLGWIRNFTAGNGDLLTRNKWTIQTRRYRALTQIWGVCINDEILFLGTSYWDCGKVRGGSQNPVTLVRSDTNKYSWTKISEFIGWFEYYWSVGT